MGFTDDGQADEGLIRGRDRRIGISSSQRRKSREKIPTPEVAEGANAWESGQTVQTRLQQMSFKW